VGSGVTVPLFGVRRRPVVPLPALSEYGIPLEAELPEPWKGSGPGAAAHLYDRDTAIGYALFTLRPGVDGANLAAPGTRSHAYTC